MQTRRWFGRATLAACMCVYAVSAAAQSDDTRPAGSTFLGDTGLWFVPTAEVLGDKQVAGGGHVATFNREQGFTAVQSMAGTFAVGFRDRIEVFGSLQFLTRIDRDLRPLFQQDQTGVGGLVPELPLVAGPFSGNQIGDFVVGAKVNLLSERELAPYALAIRGWVKLPTGDEATGTTTGEVDGAIGLVMSKNLGNAELAGHYDFVLRSDAATIDLPNSLRWGIGVGAPVGGPIRVFGELLSEVLLNNSLNLSAPLVGSDGSLSGLSSPQRSQFDVILGAQWNGPRGIAVGGGMTWAARPRCALRGGSGRTERRPARLPLQAQLPSGRQGVHAAATTTTIGTGAQPAAAGVGVV